MPHAVLNEDWSEYDNRKIRGKVDASKFSCEEAWEVDYLISKLRKHFPGKSDATIKAVISSACAVVRAPRPRTEFVTAVLSRL